MKRFLLTCWLSLGLVLNAVAGNVVSLSSAQASPSQELEIVVSLSHEDAVSAVELNIPLGDMLRYVESSAQLNAACSDGHSLTAAEKDGILSMVVFSPSLSVLKSTSSELCRFRLKLGKEPAEYPILPTVILSDAQGKALPVDVNEGVVTILAPKIEVLDKTIDFGRVPIRGRYTQTFALRNVGTSTLTISEFLSENLDFICQPSSMSLDAGASANVTLQYAPMQRGDVSTSLSIVSDAMNPKEAKVSLKAKPYSVNELHVMAGAEGASDTEVTIRLKMNNMEPIAAAQCQIVLPEGLTYVEGSASPGLRCATSNHQAQAVMQGNNLHLMLYSSTNSTLSEGDGELMSFKLKLSAPSGSYYLEPKEVALSNAGMENMTSGLSGEYVLVHSPRLQASSSLSFGNIPVTMSSTVSYEIRNDGEIPLTINKVAFLSEGFEIENELPLSIVPGGSASLSVRYTPSKEGSFKISMQVYSNDPQQCMTTVSVSGNVYEPNALRVSGENTPNGYCFDFSLDNYTEIVAIQMNIKWLPGMNTSADALRLSNRLKNHAHVLTQLSEDTYQLLVYSMANMPVSGSDGVIFSLEYTAASGLSYRDTELMVSDIVLSDAAGRNYVSEASAKAVAVFNHFPLRFEVEGQVLSEDFLKMGTALVYPEMPEREGYHFLWQQSLSAMPAAETTIKGSYLPNKYWLTFVVDGEIVMSDSVAFGTEIVLPEVEEREGFSFSGWQNVPQTMPASDVTLSAGFTANKYLVTFVLDGEIFKTDSVTYGTEIMLPEVAEIEGFSFSGWQNVPETMPANDVRIEASFSANKYLVTFVLDGEIFKTDSVTYGTEITLPEIEEREGHTFSGWQNVPETMSASDVRIEASFTANKYLVTFMLDGEVFKTDSVTYGTKLVLPEVEEREGFSFSGWQNVPQTMPASDVRIEASFTANKYLVTFVLDGEIFKTDSVTYGTEITLPEVAEKEGHTFSGWQNVPETMPASDVRIEASFTANKYLVTFILDGEIIKTDSVTYGTEITLPEVAEREGHTFSGWQNAPETMPAKDVRIEASFTANKYLVTFILDGEIFKTDSVTYETEITLPEVEEKEGFSFSGWQNVPETMPASDVRIEATFTTNKYLVTFVLDGEIFKTDSVTYGTEITLPEVEEKEGYTFSGWQNVPETMPANDMIIEGTFTVNIYAIIYKVDGEIYAVDSVAYGANIVLRDEPVREGYKFSGWSQVPETMPAADVEVTGSFTVGIGELRAESKVNVYNLQGKVLYRQVRLKDVYNNLPQGIYVVSGKKLIIK